MTREEELDWLCRLRSEIYVYMPKEWLIPMNNALDMVIKELKQEPILDKIEPKCDRINSLASVLPYTAHREIQELLCEIMDMRKAESEDEE